MFDHIYLYYSLREDAYTNVSSDPLDYPMAHIADWCVEQWWRLYSEHNTVETVNLVEYA